MTDSDFNFPGQVMLTDEEARAYELEQLIREEDEILAAYSRKYPEGYIPSVTAHSPVGSPLYDEYIAYGAATRTVEMINARRCDRMAKE